jgi:hypothetical protein
MPGGLNKLFTNKDEDIICLISRELLEVKVRLRTPIKGFDIQNLSQKI